MGLWVKEVNMFEGGDYVVDMEEGMGGFGGVVGIGKGKSREEVMKVV